MLILKKICHVLALVLVTWTTVLSGSVFAQSVTVVEFYNKTLDAYFITGRPSEQLSLDALPDFRRTGMTFDAFKASTPTVGVTRICRFYISLSSPFTSSHFYGREGVDCDQIQAQNLPGFNYEGYDFSVAEPTNGLCPTGTTPVYRGFRAAARGKTSNHRYTTSPETYVAAQNLGYAAEKAAFCATSVTDVASTFDSTAKCGTFYYPTKRVSYQTLASDGTAGGFQRYLETGAFFNGRTDATAVIEAVPGSLPLKVMIVDSPSSWTLLGTSTVDATGYDQLYYTSPTTFPRSFLTGQSVSLNSQLTYSRPNEFGVVNQTGSITYVGKESVTVPLGTYSSACKFATQQITTYSGNGQTTTTNSTNWVADVIGIVKTVTETKTSLPLGPTVDVTTTTEAVFAQPL